MMAKKSDAGMAVFAAIAAMALVAALGASLLLAGSTESAIAANFRVATEARFAADAGLAAALADLRAAPDWTSVPGGPDLASFSDLSHVGPWLLADGSSIDVSEAVNQANCRKPTSCTPAELQAATAERPWGAGNPRWRLFGVAHRSDLVADLVRDDACLVVAMVADDPADNDGDPLRDGLEVGFPNPGGGVLVLRAEAFCTRRAHKIIEATISRSGTGGDTAAAGWVVSRRELN